ncbi:cupin domain-containing protein [Nakamurella endophytica]|uniref:Cupin n=1 Tax=Nakamurella endophytica TaxID=1748367 RepID=A0A917SRR2_9ACTN|nr:cupin domain-containing protein [Nakamurella endophytica]GGL94300.1 cupin [Nakamurella endophytica]
MPVFHQSDAVVYETHGSLFRSFVTPSRGSRELCAWQLTVPAGLIGVEHRPDREEVLLVVAGDLVVTVDGTTATAHAGSVVLVPAGSEFRVDGGPSGATAWVTTTPGLEAVTADGTRIRPPWAR